MSKKNLERQLQRKVPAFYRRFFERGAENRFTDLIEAGTAAVEELVSALDNDDRGERIDALLGLGRIFTTHGAPEAALRAVVAHSKTIREKGMGPERQAALFAMGRSGEISLVDSFVPLLAADDPSAVNVAVMVLGYARNRDAEPMIRFIANRNDRDTVHTAIWALGQIGSAESLDVLLAMLRRGENVDWIVGALGDIGDPTALEDLVPLLSHERPDLRFSAVASISTIVDRRRDRKERRGWQWMIPSLHTASRDRFPPVAVFALLTLAELGEALDEDAVRRAFDISLETLELSPSQNFILGHRGLN